MLTAEDLRRLLCDLGDTILAAVLATRDPASAGTRPLTDAVAETAADTIYEIDRISDEALLEWFTERWPAGEPVEVVSEALDVPITVGGPDGSARWTCIVDPIDGTRGLMYDKRSAWVLAAVAPRDPATPARSRLRDVAAAAMTELPTTRQWSSDQVSGTRGCGPGGLVAERADVRGGGRSTLRLRPSTATDLLHGFASLAKFFPQGKAAMAACEEQVWAELYGHGRRHDVAIFDDQYLSTGGQFMELMSGRDRFLGDLRPLAAAELGYPPSLACHPYDCCTVMLLEEAGCVVTAPDGTALDTPLDTTSPVAWLGYANRSLAAHVAPAVERAIADHFPAATPPSPSDRRPPGGRPR